MAKLIEAKLTDRQTEAVAQVMVEAFGAHIQSGWATDKPDTAYVAWQFGPNLPVMQAFIDTEGTVVFNG